MNIRTKMMITLLVPLIILIGGLSLVAYHYSTKEAELELQRSISYKMDADTASIGMVFTEQEAILRTLAVNMAGKDADQIRSMLKPVLDADHDNLKMGLFAARQDGSYIDAAGRVLPADFDPRTRGWYKAALDNEPGKISYTEAYVDTATGKMCVTLSTRSADGQVVELDMNLDNIQKIVNNIYIGESGHAFLLDGKGDFIAHPSYKAGDNIGQVDGGKLKNIADAVAQNKDGFDNLVVNSENENYIYSAKKIPGTGWLLCTSVSEKEMYANERRMGYILVASGIAIALILMGIILFTVRKITMSLNIVASFAETLAAGDLRSNFVISDEHRDDEIGDVAKVMLKIKESWGTVLKKIHDGSDQLSAYVSGLTDTMGQSAQASSQIAQSIASVAADASKQLEHIERANSEVCSIVNNIDALRTNIEETANYSTSVVENAQKGQSIADLAIKQMESIESATNDSAKTIFTLGEQSRKIGKIVGSIAEIAGQTNLLALNAAIEAARAGENGKGFAVVAEEVRKLAEQSQGASAEIAELIGAIQKDTDIAVASMQTGTKEVSAGAGQVRESADFFHKITDNVNEMSARLEEITAAVEKIAKGASVIQGNVEDISRTSSSTSGETQTVSAASEEQAASIEETAASADSLKKLADELQDMIKSFKV
ncbi:methyl-accepting chemotaxis protein [Pectinatus haikarae]|uniref:methyl-accepting chemotaxis protein n=1 Tax=Pectinatus haikarae TaxID=349096 RepID=UPI0018C84122